MPLPGALIRIGLVSLLATGCSSSGDDGIGDLSNAHAGRCAADNAYDSTARLADPPQSRREEREWIRAYFAEAYLWNAEIPAVDIDAPRWDEGDYAAAMQQWFAAQRTPAVTAAGKARDRFSFLYPSEAYRRIANAGVLHGYGLEWRVDGSAPTRDVRVAYVNPSTPAAGAGIQRGDRLEAVTIGGTTVAVDTVDPGAIARLNQALYPPRGTGPVGFRLRSNAGDLREISLVPADVASQPVLVDTVHQWPVRDRGTVPVGYLVVNDFVAPAEGQLVAAFERFRAAGVSELVVDLRYNGGGYLYLASQLAAMIAGPAASAEPVFERLRYNDRRMATMGAARTDLRFQTRTTGYAGSGTAAGLALPALALARVVILTTAETCSASESVINGLAGIDVPVVRIGSTTCGKPYGFRARDNCGVSYFPIEFQGVNAKGFGEYDDGFAPACAGADDLGRPLGDPAEGLLAAALDHLATGACAAPPRPAGARPEAKHRPAADVAADASSPAVSGFWGASEVLLVRDPARRNRYLRGDGPD